MLGRSGLLQTDVTRQPNRLATGRALIRRVTLVACNARRGAEAKPALFQGFGLLKGEPVMNRTTKRIGALGTATVAVIGTGVAFAAWTATGTGAGSAKASSASD